MLFLAAFTAWLVSPVVISSPGKAAEDTSAAVQEHTASGAVLTDESCRLEQGETAVVTGIVDGDTVILHDGREVRLKGIQAPKLPLGRAGFEPWPLSGEAKARLTEMAEGEAVSLRYGGARTDRHGRVLAHVFVARAGGEVWLQQAMLNEGLARVYTFPDNRACAEQLLAAEWEARSANRGIWPDPFYAIRDASDVADLYRHLGRFELVEGKVQNAALVRGRLYLNFGDDYRSDFTVTVQESDVRIFRKDESWAALLQAEDGTVPSLEHLAARTIRVRGWIGRNNGPEIAVTHPEQIEFIDGQD